MIYSLLSGMLSIYTTTTTTTSSHAMGMSSHTTDLADYAESFFFFFDISCNLQPTCTHSIKREFFLTLDQKMSATGSLIGTTAAANDDEA